MTGPTIVPVLLALALVAYHLVRVGQAFLAVALGRRAVPDVGLVARCARIEAELRDALGEDAPAVCQGCGLELPPDSRFCSRCGAHLG